MPLQFGEMIFAANVCSDGSGNLGISPRSATAPVDAIEMRHPFATALLPACEGRILPLSFQRCLFLARSASCGLLVFIDVTLPFTLPKSRVRQGSLGW